MDGKRENSMFEEITNGIAFLYKPFIDKIESDNKKSGVPYRHYLPILLDVPDIFNLVFSSVSTFIKYILDLSI